MQSPRQLTTEYNIWFGCNFFKNTSTNTKKKHEQKLFIFQHTSLIWHYFRTDQLVHVFYVALNFRDVLLATGKLQVRNSKSTPTGPELNLCCEYSGISNKNRVMGIINHGALGLQIKAHPSFTWDVPEHWSLEDAATVTTVYLTVR